MSKKDVAVVGAGFSGLSTAFFLAERGHRVTVYEMESEVGGLIHTLETPAGLIETAANGFLNTTLWERVFSALNLQMCFPNRESRTRYIFRGRLRRWPLGIVESFDFLVRISLRFVFARKTFRPLIGETVRAWRLRCLGKPMTQYLLEPGLGGIYAGDPEKMSASLVLSSFFGEKKAAKPLRKGLASAPKGMGQILIAMRTFVEGRGGQFIMGSRIDNLGVLTSKHQEVTLARGPQSAAKLLMPHRSEVAEALNSVEGLPVLSVSLGFEPSEKQPKGFGVLFPRDQGVRTLGVLFSSSIFPGRSTERLETWILGGGTDKRVIELSDSEILRQILDERNKVFQSSELPKYSRIQRWAVSIPHCDITLEKTLKKPLDLPPQVRLVGNYLGGIGLSKILDRAYRVSEEISLS